MAREPMSAARLAEIRARAYTMYPLSSYPLEPNLVEWMGVASDDRCSLLAEVERLRAREAALVEIVRAVADADVICNHYFDILDGYPHAPEHVDYLCPTVGHPKASTVRAQARVLLATESKRSDGDGA